MNSKGVMRLVSAAIRGGQGWIDALSTDTPTILPRVDDTALYIGNGTNSFDLRLYGASSAGYVSWDASANSLKLEDSVLLGFGTNTAGQGTVGDITINWNGTKLLVAQATANSAIDFGVDGAGIDIVCYGDTAGTTMTWDQSADALVFAGTPKIDMAANAASALTIRDGTTALLTFDTRNTVTVQNILWGSPASQTLPNGATSRMRVHSIPAKTVTLAGTTQVTTENLGAQMFIDAPTYAQSGGAVTVDRVSTLHVGKPVAGSSVTITTNHIISTDTAGCFCTAAGVWTDTCGTAHKDAITDVDLASVPAVIDSVRAVTFKRKDASDGGHRRFGVLAEQVPDELASKDRTGVAAIDLAGLSLAGIKYLLEENRDMRQRLEALEKGGRKKVK